MNIGILGAGNVGGTLGEAFAKAGHPVCFGVRDAGSEDVKTMLDRMHGRGHAGVVADAVAFGNVVVNALPWGAVKDVLSSLDLKGKTLLDCTNPLLPNLAGLEVGTTTSGGELVAEWAPGAHVVKIFNTTGYDNMANPNYKGQPISMFYCGDDAEAKKTAAGLARDIGFNPMDAGPLANSRVLEPYALLWIWLAVFGGLGRDFAFQVVKR
jgi:predicted dinucleotide-binding enzyme